VTPGEDIRELEEKAMNALPALESERYDGWVLRAAGGYTGRANSAAPLYPGRLETIEKILHTEAWFQSRALTPMIRLTPGAQPPRLESILEERGYTLRDEGVSVQVRELDRSASVPDGVEIAEGPVPDWWLAMLAAYQATVADHLSQVGRLFARLPAASAFAAVHHEEMPVAIGRAVVESGSVGLFDVFTRQDQRRRGLGRAITQALLAWGARNGAARAYLQVVPSNEAACRLYDRLGFRVAYRYWYRVAPVEAQGRSN
jgi:GNAT superfamily N-acetyltransferase